MPNPYSYFDHRLKRSKKPKRLEDLKKYLQFRIEGTTELLQLLQSLLEHSDRGPELDEAIARVQEIIALVLVKEVEFAGFDIRWKK